MDRGSLTGQVISGPAESLARGEMMQPFSLGNPRAASRADVIERWASVAAATALVGYGFRRRSISGLCLAAAATPLLYRAWAGEWPRFTNGIRADGDTRVALAGNRGVHVRESIRLEKPVDEIYRFWRKLENLPQFMSHLERVTESGDKRSHWVAKGPAGLRVRGRRTVNGSKTQSSPGARLARRRHGRLGDVLDGPCRTQHGCRCI
jgi:uncharacterized membrane protein